MKTKKSKGLWKKKRGPKKRIDIAKEARRRREATGRSGPRRRELTNYRRTYKYRNYSE